MDKILIELKQSGKLGKTFYVRERKRVQFSLNWTKFPFSSNRKGQRLWREGNVKAAAGCLAVTEGRAHLIYLGKRLPPLLDSNVLYPDTWQD